MFRSSPRRRQPDAPPTHVRWARGIVALTCVALVAWLVASVYNGVPGRHYRTVYVQIPTVGNLLAHDPVRIGGVRVGQVEQLQTTRSGAARVQLQLDPGTELPADTSVALRANGLLGARYVQLVPGHAHTMLKPGATITAGSGALTNGIPQALDVFDARTRAALGITLDELGRGTVGQGEQLNDAIRELSDALVPFQRLTGAILDRTGAADRLFPAADAMVRPLDASRGDLAGLISDGARAVAALDDGSPALRAVLRPLPGTLRQTRLGAGAGTRLLAATEGLARASNNVLPAAPAGLRAATRLLRDAPGPLRSARPVLASLRRASPPLRRALAAAPPTLTRLSTAVTQASPIVRAVGPYKCDIANFGVVFRSVTGFGGEGNGPNGPLGEFRLMLVAPDLLEAAGSAHTTRPTAAYPKPCTLLGNRYPRNRGTTR